MKAGYYNTKESVEEYIRLSKDVNGSLLIERLDKFLLKGSKLLEIGTGPGTDWNILNTNYLLVGSDNSTEFLNHLNTNYPHGNFVQLDASKLDTNENFDGIYSNKVMHHLKDNEFHYSIKRQHQILNSEGIICHSFWKGEGSETFKGLFVNYHSKESLIGNFKDYFEILVLEQYAEFEDGDSLLLIGKKISKC